LLRPALNDFRLHGQFERLQTFKQKPILLEGKSYNGRHWHTGNLCAIRKDVTGSNLIAMLN